jgi:hypothetical protein
MKMFTYEEYARYLQPYNVDYALRNLIRNDEVPFEPNYVVDDLKGRSGLKHLISERTLEGYGITFQDKAHMAPDKTTFYFVNENDALMFILSLGD